MKFGIVISMYDETHIVRKTIDDLRANNCIFFVVQSDPGSKDKMLEKSLCERYELMSDLAGSRNNYEKIVESFKNGNPEPIGPIALTRNFSRGFSLTVDYDLDYVIGITGDVSISNMRGMSTIITKMLKTRKKIAGTRTIGYTLYDKEGHLTRFQDKNSTDIMPQFFLADAKLIKEGLFCNIQRTNKYNTEQCLGDEIKRFCKSKNVEFFDLFYSICDYAYPRFIDGLNYNPDKLSKMPSKIEGIVNYLRRRISRNNNEKLTKIFQKVLKH